MFVGTWNVGGLKPPPLNHLQNDEGEEEYTGAVDTDRVRRRWSCLLMEKSLARAADEAVREERQAEAMAEKRTVRIGNGDICEGEKRARDRRKKP